MRRHAILIAGPTASGKSMLALEVARKEGGVIINADSMQVYGVLSHLSARPQSEELAQTRHELYGIIPPETRFSTGGWLDAVTTLIGDQTEAFQTFVFVGGTGLYFQALLEGIAAIPPVPMEIVREIEDRVRVLSGAERLALLKKTDPEMAQVMVQPDPQRLVRALSVLQATGRSLADWQGEAQRGVLQDFRVSKIVLNPRRELLNQRIERRFKTMLERGGVEEVKRLVALDLDPSLPVMKAIGVREISRWLTGEFSQEQVIERSVIATRQYAKRQRTWFRKQMCDWNWRSD